MMETEGVAGSGDKRHSPEKKSSIGFHQKKMSLPTNGNVIHHNHENAGHHGSTSPNNHHKHNTTGKSTEGGDGFLPRIDKSNSPNSHKKRSIMSNTNGSKFLNQSCDNSISVVGPGQYDVTSIFESNSSNPLYKKAPSFSINMGRHNHKTVVSHDHVQDNLGDHSPGVAFYNQSDDGLKKAVPSTKLNSSVKFDDYSFKKQSEKSPGPLRYECLYPTDISSQNVKSLGHKFVKDLRFPKEKPNGVPSPQDYLHRSQFEENGKLKGAALGPSREEYFKKNLVRNRELLTRTPSPGPSSYEQDTALRQTHVKYSFGKEDRGVLKAKIRDAHMGPGVYEVEEDKIKRLVHKRAASCAFTKAMRSIDTRKWGQMFAAEIPKL